MGLITADIMDDRLIVNGTEARAYLLFPDGRRKAWANLIKFSAQIDYSKTQYPVLGMRTKPSRKGQGTITGSSTQHYNASEFREAALEYQNTGVDSYYDVQIVNEDPNSGIGRQTVVLYGLNFDSVPLALIDAEADYLTEDLSFTANSFDLENVFGTGGLKDA